MKKYLKIAIGSAAAVVVISAAVMFALFLKADASYDVSKLLESSANESIKGTFAQEISDSTIPNRDWWVKRWCTNMKGAFVQGSAGEFINNLSVIDAPKSNDSNGIVSVSEKDFKIEIVYSSTKKNEKLAITGINASSVSVLDKVKVSVESVKQGSASTIISSPVIQHTYNDKVDGGKLKINLNNEEVNDIYHITIELAGTQEAEEYVNGHVSKRYEAEASKLENAQVVSSDYIVSQGGAVKSELDILSKLTFKINVPQNGSYALNLVASKIALQGDESADAFIEAFIDDGEDTALLDTSDALSIGASKEIAEIIDLEKGSHTISIIIPENMAIEVDCIDITLLCDQQEPLPENVCAAIAYSEKTNDENSAFIIVASENAYYNVAFDALVTDEQSVTYKVDGTDTGTFVLAGNSTYNSGIFLKKGINIIEIPHSVYNLFTAVTAREMDDDLTSDDKPTIFSYEPKEAALKEALLLEDTNNTPYVGDISVVNGQISYKVNSPVAALYKLTLKYSNGNSVSQVSAAQTDYVPLNVDVGGALSKMQCLSTHSDEKCTISTIAVNLAQGENVITLSIDSGTQGNEQSSSKVRVYGMSLAKAQFDINNKGNVVMSK